MFLREPPEDEETAAAYAEEREADGYVSNNTRLWSWRPDLLREFLGLRSGLLRTSALTERESAVLVTSTAATLGDSYCALAWGARLAELSDDDTAAHIISNEPAPALSEREAALRDWARRVVADPNATTEADVAGLRDVGLGDKEIFEATALIAFRLAFSTINDALGAAPDSQLAEATPDVIREAVSFGRPPGSAPSS
jgi:uncharacterized peroxidase-related enzyme